MRCEQRRCDQDKQDRLRQSLEVDGGCGEQGLDFPVLAAASGGSCHAVKGFCQSVRAFDPPAVAGMKPGFGLAPGEAFATGAQHVDIGFGDMDATCGSVIQDALCPQRASPAGVRTGVSAA